MGSVAADRSEVNQFIDWLADEAAASG
jgi:hypothetical protein